MAEKKKTERLQLRKSASTFKIVIPESVESKIRHLCSIVHDVEWSGTLFYRHEGSLEDGTFKVICVDLFVMDIGSSAYTEYDESPDVLTYRIDHDLLGEDIQEGLIHSHNNMSTFFSGTDTNTLIDEGTNSNHFVSLIVNNAGVYTAGVTRKITTAIKAEAHIKYTENEYYDSYDNQRIITKDSQVREEDREETKVTQIIEWFELEVEKADVANNFEEIDSRLAEIRRSKSRPKISTIISPSSSYKVYNGYNGVQTLNDREKYPYVSSSKQSVKEEPKQQTLFNEWEYDETDTTWRVYPKQGELPKVKKSADPNDTYETPLCLMESFDKELIKSLALQLLTGSIIINEKAIDPDKWVEKMDTIYEKRFGPLDIDKYPPSRTGEVLGNNERLEEWIDGMCDFLLYTEDEDLLDRLNLVAGRRDYYDTSDTVEVCAGDLINYLETLPESYVKNIMVKRLLRYLPNGTEEYFVSKKP